MMGVTRAAHGMIATVSLLAGLVSTASPARAVSPDVVVGAKAEAIWYFYKPSHPMGVLVGRPTCTGGWAVRGTDGLFFVTAGHCFDLNFPIAGLDGVFGRVARNDYAAGVDALLVKPELNVDAFQEVPGSGRVTSRASDIYTQRDGNPIGMQGNVTGWSEGVTRPGWKTSVAGNRVACATYASTGGDSGAPVLVRTSSGVMAVGIHIGRRLAEGLSCYMTINDLLRQFGATLPVFPTVAGGATEVGPSDELANDAPHYPVDGKLVLD